MTVLTPARKQLAKRVVHSTRSFLSRKSTKSTLQLAATIAVLILKAHAQSGSPLDTPLNNLVTDMTGPVGQAAALLGITAGGIGMVVDKNGNHKGWFITLFIGCILIFSAQKIVSWLFL